MRCFMPGVAFVPALLVTWSSAAFIIPYVVAVLGGHVDPLVPYISDTGTKPPESGIFGFMINISSLLGVATMYIRYLIIEKQNESSHFISSSFNILSLSIGLMGCVGMGIVATFQELSVPSVHDIGALVAFGSVIVFASQISMTKIHWIPSEKDYVYHFVSAICEWIVAFGFILFFFTFIRDFQMNHVSPKHPVHGYFKNLDYTSIK
ncbi:DNA damage-regulated autophagy modulator protein 1 isoform X5 [Apteryx rowi]|uniref:DNA damage-regulated autophagy modulator protein 1 isoform X5 n=1 Tax=Apteryx rowi TaxID=308060 RepID=UPI000E1CA35F|nr:DNA damage-regulated autophagy modulator protein 1 isoform X5 [Apteryx rowi]